MNFGGRRDDYAGGEPGRFQLQQICLVRLVHSAHTLIGQFKASLV